MPRGLIIRFRDFPMKFRFVENPRFIFTVKILYFFFKFKHTLNSGILNLKKQFLNAIKLDSNHMIRLLSSFFQFAVASERDKKRERDKYSFRLQEEENQELNKTTNNRNYFLLIDNASDKTRGFNKFIFILITIERDRARRRRRCRLQ